MRSNEYETEAEVERDRSAPRRREDPNTQAALAPGAPPSVQRAAMLDLQRAAGNARASQLLEEDDPASSVRDVVGSSGGQALDGDTRSFMESRLGADFGSVRIHTGGAAAESARGMSAQAYTVGDDIVFGEGKYDPGSDSGRRMLAHELTHVVQQRSGPVDGSAVGGGLKVSDPSDRFEQAAERSADAVMSGGGGAHDGVSAQRDAGSVQRENAEEDELQMMGEEEDELQMMGEEEDELQMMGEEEEELQMTAVQRETTEEEAEEEELAEG